MSTRKFLKEVAQLKSNAAYVEYGYGQVEPNHLSAQRNGKIYAQLPVNKEIPMLEQGQFVKYDYAANENGIGECNFTGKGEWMLVYNEIKLYRDHQMDCEFSMRADEYNARVYTPYDWENVEKEYRTRTVNGANLPKDPYNSKEPSADTEGFDPIERIAIKNDPYEISYNDDPFYKLGVYQEKMMNHTQTSSMVPRVFKTDIGDIMTTNTINEKTLVVGDLLTPQDKDGILAKAGAELISQNLKSANKMVWQVVKVYTMPDGQKGVKIMRIQ